MCLIACVRVTNQVAVNGRNHDMIEANSQTHRHTGAHKEDKKWWARGSGVLSNLLGGVSGTAGGRCKNRG